MAAQFEVLSPAETTDALASATGRNETLRQLSDSLMAILDSESSVFVTHWTPQLDSSLRTKMKRLGVTLSVHQVTRNGVKGHVLQARSVA